jgi:hypothetical protein
MPNSIEKARSWLEILKRQALPNYDSFIQQLAVGQITNVCQCGCNGFDFHVPDAQSSIPLKAGPGLFCELAFESNLPEEVNILIFTDFRGFLSRVDVTYGASNAGAMPDSIHPVKLKGIWPASI